MGFPTVASSATSKEASYSGSDFVVTMPSGITAGDLLLVVVAFGVAAERNYATPSGWTLIDRTFGNSGWETYIYAKEAVGSDTLTVAKGGAGASGVAIAYRITGNFGGGAADVEASLVSSFANPANPPSLTPSWGSGDVTWFAGSVVSEADGAPTAYPTGYSSNQLSVVEGGVSYRLSMASREAAGTSEDPGVYSYAGTPPFGQPFTIGVRGVSSGSTLLLDAGSYSVSGQTANTLATRLLELNVGNYVVNGQNATLTYAQPGTYTLALDGGAYSIAGVDAFRIISTSLDAGSYAVSGQDVAFNVSVPQSYVLTCDGGSYLVLGRNAFLLGPGDTIPVAKGNQTISVRVGISL